jgi:hypothetical protein
MAISDAIKTDLLYKKLFGVTKTDTSTNKTPSNEATASPFINRGDKTWTQASLIPTTAAATTGIVQAYIGSSKIETVGDSTTTKISAIAFPTWNTGLTDWIPPEFDTANVTNTYRVKVYYGVTGLSDPATSGGTQIFADGSGGIGEWYFDYQSGVLNFIGGTLPAGMISTSIIYIYGYRYIGTKGFAGQTLPVNNLRTGYTTTATATATTTLTNTSTQNQFFTGSLTQTVILPVASTLSVGDSYYIQNNSSSVVTVQSSGANNILGIPTGIRVKFTCILASGTTAASWDPTISGYNSTTYPDGIVSFTKSLTLTTNWQDTGISFTDLATGTYLVQLYANDISAGGTSNNEYYSGTMSWYNGTTDTSASLPTDEVALHRSGASSEGGLYLRTFRSTVAAGTNLKLQIYANTSNSSASNYVFKFRRMI